MNKLSALDAGFLYNETDRSPQHVASLQIMELPAGMATDTFIDGLKRFLLKRIHLVPYLTNKLQWVPFALDHPVWIRDCEFSIDNHVYTDAVAAPSGRRQLEEKVATLHSQRMDRKKPLWEIVVLTGLEGGHIAYYNRVHHACMDGMAGQAATQLLMDTVPEAANLPAVAPEGFFTGHRQQSQAALLVGAFENFAKFQIRQSAAWTTNLETAARLFQRALDPGKGLGAVVRRAPRTPFNRAVLAKRSFSTGEIDLAEIKALGKVERGEYRGATVNDLFLAVCGGGLRRYLARSGDLPRDSLIAGCPVSLRLPGDSDMDNKLTMMQVTLATDEADPVERLTQIAHSAHVAKGFVADLADGVDPNLSYLGLPALMSGGARLQERSGLFDVAEVPFNVVVSNVPGPRETLYSNGAKMLTHFPVSIPTHTLGVNITVQSYAGALYFAVTACARALPDPQVLIDDMLTAFLELQERLSSKSLVPTRQPGRKNPRKGPEMGSEAVKAA
ncbi:MAG: wax ester/triacylglycerol synthase family O-acyltransferase [Gammaproteobacteria bacterium]|nr:wax ester/triacylglycerol synthase family O-acyltransferase [Gammaproteobacteria bacterium]